MVKKSDLPLFQGTVEEATHSNDHFFVLVGWLSDSGKGEQRVVVLGLGEIIAI